MNKEVLNLFKIFSSAHDCWILELGKRMSLFKKRSAINWFFTSVYKIKCFQLGPPLIQNIANRYSSKCCLHARQNAQHALCLGEGLERENATASLHMQKRAPATQAAYKTPQVPEPRLAAPSSPPSHVAFSSFLYLKLFPLFPCQSIQREAALIDS